MFNLTSLKGENYSVENGKYTYHLSVCGGLQKDVCTHTDASREMVASCQVDGSSQKIGGTELSKIAPPQLSSIKLRLSSSCRNSKPGSELRGRPAHPELHGWRDVSQDLPEVHRDLLFLSP